MNDIFLKDYLKSENHPKGRYCRGNWAPGSRWNPGGTEANVNAKIKVNVAQRLSSAPNKQTSESLYCFVTFRIRMRAIVDDPAWRRQSIDLRFRPRSTARFHWPHFCCVLCRPLSFIFSLSHVKLGGACLPYLSPSSLEMRIRKTMQPVWHDMQRRVKGEVMEAHIRNLANWIHKMLTNRVITQYNWFWLWPGPKLTLHPKWPAHRNFRDDSLRCSPNMSHMTTFNSPWKRLDSPNRGQVLNPCH